jgi:hypothetical protein
LIPAPASVQVKGAAETRRQQLGGCEPCCGPRADAPAARHELADRLLYAAGLNRALFFARAGVARERAGDRQGAPRGRP